MQIKPLIAFILGISAAVPAQISFETWCQSLCPEGSICGKGRGETEEKADENANKEIAKGISSSIGSISTDILSVEEKDGSLDELRSYVQNTIVESSLENMEASKSHRRYKENEVFASERYMCKSAAAKPYLSKLRHLKDSLKISAQKINKESCQGMLGVHNRIRLYEGIAENLGQMDKALKKECDALYAKMKTECEQIGMGIYVKSNSDYFEDKIGSVLADECAIANEENAANLRLDIDAKECEIKTDNVMNAVYCSACVKVNLLNNKTGKSAYKDDFKGSKVGWTDKEGACKKAYEKAVPELWEKIKGKIQKEGCK